MSPLDLSMGLSTQKAGAAQPEGGGGGEGGGDPHFANVVLLVSFDGEDAATEATDDSPSAHALTFNGDAQLDDAQAKFGDTSLLIGRGANAFVSAADSPDWRLSADNSDEFTVEAWLVFSAFGAGPAVEFSVAMGQWDTSSNERSWALFYEEKTTGATTRQIRFYWSNAGNDFSSLSYDPGGTVLEDGAFHHVAVDKDSTGKIRIYVDGVMEASTTPANSSLHDSPFELRIGQDSNSNRSWGDWIDEVRITKGIARYASDDGFEVPTAPFPRS